MMHVFTTEQTELTVCTKTWCFDDHWTKPYVLRSCSCGFSFVTHPSEQSVLDEVVHVLDAEKLYKR